MTTNNTRAITGEMRAYLDVIGIACPTPQELCQGIQPDISVDAVEGQDSKLLFMPALSHSLNAG